jgi:hypothetical protein
MHTYFMLVAEHPTSLDVFSESLVTANRLKSPVTNLHRPKQNMVTEITTWPRNIGKHAWERVTLALMPALVRAHDCGQPKREPTHVQRGARC